MKSTSNILLGGLAACILTLPLMASSVTYTYTGNDFGAVFGSYSTSDFITGYFTVASPLPDSETFPDAITPLTYSFTDGLQTFSSSAPPSGVTFEFGTDATGAITSWDVNLSQGENTISTVSSSSDVGEMLGSSSFGENIGDPGTWVQSGGGTGGGSTVPEPGNLGLLVIGLVAIGLVRRKMLVFVKP